MQLKVIDINVVIAEMLEMFKRLIGENIILETKFNTKSAKIKADVGQIQQIVMNLIVNARDAMPKGGKIIIETTNVVLDELYCRMHIDAVPGEYVHLAISDTGCGMDEATRARIFEPFYTTKELGKGTGLGLSTVYGIVRQSGGHITVYSEVGIGTTFKIFLPQVKQDLSHVSNSLMKPVTGGLETILLVEDEEEIRNLVQEILSQKGYKIILAKDGADAIRVSDEYAGVIDLMLTDVVMPTLSGKDAAIHLSRSRPALKVVYMSGYTTETISHHGVLEGDVAFLDKPFTPDSVSRKIREVLDAAE